MLKNTTQLFIVLLLLGSFSTANAGFGVSPGKVEENKLVPGSNFQNTIYLVQGDPKNDLSVKATVESAEIADWFSFIEGDEFVIPAGVQQFPLMVKINVPEDAELGEYRAFLRVNTVPVKGSNDGDVSIALGGRIDYLITVGNDVIKEYSVSSIKILGIKESEDPKVEFKIKNTGNVSAAPVAASFELFNKFGTVRLGFSEVDDFEKIASFSEESQVLDFPIDIRFAPGEYWGDVKVYDDEGKVIANLKTVFNVSEATFWDNLFSYVGKSMPLNVAGGLIILSLTILFVRGYFRRKRKFGVE